MSRMFFTKKIILDTSQFYLYKLEISLKRLWMEKITLKKFISSEMEKIHPRFSVQCKWDCFFTMKSKKIFANVIVVDKLLLAKYLESKKQRIFISSPKRQIFAPKSKLVLRILLTSLILIIGCNFGVRQDIAVNQQKTQESTVEYNEEFDNQSNTTEKEKFDIDFLAFFSDFFEKLYDENSEMYFEKFSLEENQTDETINISIVGIYPETIKKYFEEIKSEKNIFKDELDLTIEAVSYENEKVKTDCVLIKRKTKDDFFVSEISYLENSEQIPNCDLNEMSFYRAHFENENFENFLISFRNNLISHGIFPTEETLENHSLRFFAKKQEIEKVISSYDFKEEKVIKNIFISSTVEDEMIFCEIEFISSLDKLIGFSLDEILSEKMLKVLCKRSKIESEILETGKKLFQQEDLEIVGKITVTSGEKIILVKDKNGKIIKKTDD